MYDPPRIAPPQRSCWSTVVVTCSFTPLPLRQHPVPDRPHDDRDHKQRTTRIRDRIHAVALFTRLIEVVAMKVVGVDAAGGRVRLGGECVLVLKGQGRGPNE